jgi:hypothetical protein
MTKCDYKILKREVNTKCILVSLVLTASRTFDVRNKPQANSGARYGEAIIMPYVLSSSNPKREPTPTTMRPLARRILFLRPLRPPNRFFTHLPRSRPQLPFLSQPKKQVRFLTTERKQWLKGEIQRAGKYTVVLWAGSILLFTIAFGVQQEWLERKFPSPHEWSWVTRKNYRSARWNEDHGDEEEGGGPVDWARTGGAYRDLLKRLEDPAVDGARLEDRDEGGILVAGIGRTGYDITKKPEPWRRGYYEVLMGAARAAEHLDGWVRDRTRNKAFPANVVIGPSYPNPRPVPPGALSAPREEDCEAAFEPPETYYIRILTTQGFTEKQKLDAALGYATWLDYKGAPESAADMYKWALDIAASSSPHPEKVFDTTGTINPNGGPISSNILAATTALAIHNARNANLSTALPLFLSVLRSRKSLPAEKSMKQPALISEDENSQTSTGILSNLRTFVSHTLAPPKYPPPPPDGTSPPPRDAKSRCEEAALMTYIGEILYAGTSEASGREDGLAWTREAVDIAEEELRGKAVSKEAKDTCKQCLETGLSNWAKMVARLAREERERKDVVIAKKASSWLPAGLGGEPSESPTGRWQAEERVVAERVGRARDILGSGQTASTAKSGVFFM